MSNPKVIMIAMAAGAAWWGATELGVPMPYLAAVFIGAFIGRFIREATRGGYRDE